MHEGDCVRVLLRTVFCRSHAITSLQCSFYTFHRNAVNAQKAQDVNLGPEIRAMDPYLRPESRNFNKYQFKHSALKNTEHGIACSWKAAAAYATTEQKTRDMLLAKIKAEKEGAAAAASS